ncbi:MAG: 1-hydroxy-2-methyl-2-(E)-butenyl 4-diphosphate synthase [Bacteroidetes bacterium 4572_112]|nr:MAG: 1-hydroxy-2-methyl-2-(E)-butenyl 4-diphosphate synthase [Bacteroidetes bacterium 4572_112]
MSYCNNLFSYNRWETREVTIGKLKLGGNNPIRLQSMSSCRPMDTEANVEQAARIIDAGGELVRFTAPGVKDAANLELISKGIRNKGYDTALVADIHYKPDAALVAADIVEKVRINPGNYAELHKSKINYSKEEYQESLDHIESKFIVLIEKCKANKVALRIGSNHGSLSQRIMDQHGDTAQGMVEAAMEYLRIAIKHNFHEIVISMKASNILVMVQAYRLLSVKMREENMNFPLHLGVTEAGDGEDGRIKSAAGIGALLEDGLGDTIRVSLTEDPELEIPVGKMIADRYKNKSWKSESDSIDLPYNPLESKRRESREISEIGGDSEIVVLPFDYTIDMCGESFISDADEVFVYKEDSDLEDIAYAKLAEYLEHDINPLNWFVELSYEDFENDDFLSINRESNVVIVLSDDSENNVHRYREMFVKLMNEGIDLPVIIKHKYSFNTEEELQIHAAIDFGALLVDGLGDGIWIENDGNISQDRINEISLGILQATRSRITKTDFISCPSCGRTLYNIQEATAIIKSRTSHLKGLKIAIMGCIVNGPGEMADADYGYVGSGPNNINLYKGKKVIAKGIPQTQAVEALIDLIKENGDWEEE